MGRKVTAKKRQRERGTPGPKPEVLVLDGPWAAAVAEALTKPAPKRAVRKKKRRPK